MAKNSSLKKPLIFESIQLSIDKKINVLSLIFQLNFFPIGFQPIGKRTQLNNVHLFFYPV